MSNETSQDEEKENSKVLETKLNEQIRFNQQIKTEYMRRAKDIAKKLNTLLGFHVSFDDDDIKFQDKNNSENFLIFQSKPNGSISLKESDYYKTYSYLINSHLRPFKSYLVFLAAVYCDSNGLKLDVTEKSFI